MKSSSIKLKNDEVLNIRLPKRILDKIDLLCVSSGKNRSEIIRMILDKSLIYVGAENEHSK